MFPSTQKKIWCIVYCFLTFILLHATTAIVIFLSFSTVDYADTPALMNISDVFTLWMDRIFSILSVLIIAFLLGNIALFFTKEYRKRVVWISLSIYFIIALIESFFRLPLLYDAMVFVYFMKDIIHTDIFMTCLTVLHPFAVIYFTYLFVHLFSKEG